jgi:hypothetical protein
MISGYTAGITRSTSRLMPRLSLGWHDPRIVRNIGFGFALGGFVLRIVWFRYLSYSDRPDVGITPRLQQVFYFLTETPFVGLATLWALDLTGCLAPISRGLLRFVIVPAFILVGLATGTIAQALRVGLLLLFIFAMLRRRIPWLVLAIGFASLFLLQPAKSAFRPAVSAQMSGANTMISRIQTFAELAYDTATGRLTFGPGIVVFSADRLNLITTFADVLEDTPVVIPFWGGYTYYPLLTKLVPRLLYPEKRPDDAAQAFGHRYGFLSSGDLTTTYKLAQLTESYLNFGVPGVLIVMFVIGAIYRIAQEMFVHPMMGFGGVVAVGYIVTQWFDIEANLSLIFGGLAYELVYIGLVHMLVIFFEGPRYRAHSGTVQEASISG